MTKSLLLFKTLYRDATADQRREKGQKRARDGSYGIAVALVPIAIFVAVLAGYVASTVKDDLSLPYLVCLAVLAGYVPSDKNSAQICTPTTARQTRYASDKSAFTVLATYPAKTATKVAIGTSATAMP